MGTATGPGPRKRKRLGLALLALAVAGTVVALLVQGQRDRDHTARGRALYLGEATGAQVLRGRLVGHTDALPMQATRCVNCHAASVATPGGGAGVQAVFAPPLDAATLTQPRSRRGGPPSVYEAGALCRLLRTGVDPAQILLPTVMPRYDISDAQCAELWSYLSRL